MRRWTERTRLEKMVLFMNDIVRNEKREGFNPHHFVVAQDQNGNPTVHMFSKDQK